MTQQQQTHFTSRSAVISAQRCRRLRYLEYHAGPDGMGLEPRRRSVHLVVGGAVHAGLAVLLSEAQKWLDANPTLYDAESGKEVSASLQDQLEYLFAKSAVTTDGKPIARRIENMAVEAALAELRAEMTEGVELDPEETAAQQVGQQLAADLVTGDLHTMSLNDRLRASLKREEDSPIVIDFGDLAPVNLTPAIVNSPEFGMGFALPADATITDAKVSLTFTPQTDAEFLREELAALVEGMVRCYSRRRLRPLLEQFSVIEVEREGRWKLAEIDQEPDPACLNCGGRGWHPVPGMETDWGKSQTQMCVCTKAELHFLSRHDALLLERSTGYLYLQSFKTTGSWDRRKELDAQVDMQGLSEAVGVERRFGEAWGLIQCLDIPELRDRNLKRLSEIRSDLGSERVWRWLSTLPDPPTILGVRYEYLLKGSRKKDQKADPQYPDRYYQESKLIRAYMQEGITAEDRRWAWTYEWWDEIGKSRRLDYRSWRKQPVWRAMPIADWIDRLDRGEVQGEARTAGGEAMDALGEQFVPVIVQYRNRDDALDWLEQTEAQEVQIVKDVAEVRRAAQEGGYAAKRSALNRLFPMTRTSCSFPGLCPMRSTPTRPGFCFGGPDPLHDPGVMEGFASRRPNHPAELVQIVTTT